MITTLVQGSFPWFIELYFSQKNSQGLYFD